MLAVAKLDENVFLTTTAKLALELGIEEMFDAMANHLIMELPLS